MSDLYPIKCQTILLYLSMLSDPTIRSNVRMGIQDWGMDDLDLDEKCMDEIKFRFRIMEEMNELNVESVDDKFI